MGLGVSGTPWGTQTRYCPLWVWELAACHGGHRLGHVLYGLGSWLNAMVDTPYGFGICVRVRSNFRYQAGTGFGTCVRVRSDFRFQVGMGFEHVRLGLTSDLKLEWVWNMCRLG